MGKVIEDIYYVWDNNQWLRVVKSEYSYDNRGNNTMYTESERAEDQWQNSMKNEAAYDSDGNMILFEMHIDDITMFKEISVYDEHGNRTENSIYEGDWETGFLVNSWKTEASYDNNFTFEI